MHWHNSTQSRAEGGNSRGDSTVNGVVWRSLASPMALASHQAKYKEGDLTWFLLVSGIKLTSFSQMFTVFLPHSLNPTLLKTGGPFQIPQEVSLICPVEQDQDSPDVGWLVVLSLHEPYDLSEFSWMKSIQGLAIWLPMSHQSIKVFPTATSAAWYNSQIRVNCSRTWHVRQKGHVRQQRDWIRLPPGTRIRKVGPSQWNN